MRGVSKLLLALALAALLTAGFAACGSDGSDDSTAGSAATTSGGTPGVTAPDDGGSGEGGQESGDDQGGSESKESSDSSDEASAPFRTPGGDNSVQGYGEEADSSEVEEATTALSGFMQARAEADWAGQCEYLAKAAVKPLEQLAAQSPQLKGKDCATILAALSAGTPDSSRANTLTDGIASLRVEGDRGFALYHGPRGVDYFVPMVNEDGEWKVGTLAPTEFP